MNVAMLAALLEEGRIHKEDGSKFDAGETALFLRELESVDTEITETLYPEFHADEWFPIKQGVDPGADTFVWYRSDVIGEAKLIHSYSADLPNIEEEGTPNVGNIRSVGDSYRYSIQDIRAAAMVGRPLERTKAIAARKAIERACEKYAFLGSSVDNFLGAANAANVPILASGFNGAWDDPSTTPQEIYDDFVLFENTIWQQTNQVHTPNTALFGTRTTMALGRVFSTLTGETILEMLNKRPNRKITTIGSSPYLDLADAQGNGERVIVYDRSPENLHQIKPVGFESLPPQAKALSFMVPCHARTGGVVVRRPLSMLYVDGLLD